MGCGFGDPPPHLRQRKAERPGTRGRRAPGPDQEGESAEAGAPYLRLKRSTRPAVSTSLCLPV